METRWKQKYTNYHKALVRLDEIVRAAKERELNAFERDGIVQHFEFTLECAWKLMKSYAEEKGIDGIGGSRDATRYAVQLGLITDGDAWMQMIRSRNETSHNYDGTAADAAITDILSLFFPEMLRFDAHMGSLADAPGLFDTTR